MKYFLLLLASLGAPWAMQAQESSPSRFELAEGGSKDVAWPKKPDNRLSSFSGKMKDFRELPCREYGGSKEFRSESIYEDRQASRLTSVPLWMTTESEYGKRKDDRFARESAVAGVDSPHRFDPVFSRQQEARVREEKELSRKDADGWSSRSSRMGQATDGTLQMYEGRLVRVRQRVNRDAVSTDRDLGERQQEKFNPEEVQKLLKQKPGLPEIQEVVRPALPVRVESPVASRPLASGS